MPNENPAPTSLGGADAADGSESPPAVGLGMAKPPVGRGTTARKGGVLAVKAVAHKRHTRQRQCLTCCWLARLAAGSNRGLVLGVQLHSTIGIECGRIDKLLRNRSVDARGLGHDLRKDRKAKARS